jgi:phenylacetate-CoA ligase
VARSPEVDWGRYDITALYGGEGMSEGMRAHLQRHAFRRVLGDYGASDLEINIAAESEFTIALRQVLAERPSLRQRLNRGHGDELPMLFQYNPLDYLVETNAAGELVITLTRTEAASPKIRYNIHDLGHVIPFSEVKRTLAAEGLDPAKLAPGAAHLPLLFLYGRSDLAVAFYGCKITPGQVEQAIFSIEALSSLLNSFTLVVYEDDAHDKRLSVALELIEGAAAPQNTAPLRDALYASLAGISQDFREASRMVPAGKAPALEFYAEGTGPFAGTDVRLKRNYIRTLKPT